MGDVVCALPLFHTLRTVAPDARIAWVVQPEFAGLLQSLPGLDRVIKFDRRGRLGAWLNLKTELRSFRADIAIDAQGNWKSAAVMGLSRAPRKFGMATVDWREPSAARVLTEQAPALPNDQAHIIQRTLALSRFVAESLGADADAITPRFDPDLAPVERARGRDLADRHFPGANGSSVVLHLAAKGDVRSWPPDYYRVLAEQLLAKGQRVLLLSGPGEKDHGHHLRHVLGMRPGLSHWIDQNNLREASAFFAECAQRSIPMVASDSGSMHLAAANGVRVVTLCGPQDAARTGPWPVAPDTPHRTLRAQDSPDCAPCFSRTCRHPKGNVCMENITPEAVADLCLSLADSSINSTE